MFRKVMMILFVGVIAFTSGASVAGPQEDAAKAFANGQALLAKADFTGAIQAFKTAVQADKGNQEYRQQYALLRQIMRMRGQIEKEKNPTRWRGMARALRSYYHTHRLFTEALVIDRKIHQQDPTPESAATLAETQLELGMNSEAVETLRTLEDAEATAQTNVLLGVALARQGKADEAKALAAKVTPEDDADPPLFFHLASLRALIGDSAGAMRALTASFEATPPSQLEAAKARAKGCPDLAKLVSTTEFAKVLKTQSKIEESKCSGGTSCGSCPKRAGCGSCPHAKKKP